MTINKELSNLIDNLSSARDEINLKLHLASMDARDEFEDAEKQWHLIKNKAAEISDESIHTSEEFIGKAKIIADELEKTYKRLSKRLSE